MNKPHKHAELIKAWADGAEIEWYDEYHSQYFNCTNPSWCDNTKYRIKPKPKPKWEKRQEFPLFYERYDCYIPQKVHDFDTIHQFVVEFETDWDNQHYEVLKSNVGYYRHRNCASWPFSVCAIRMSKECAEKLCKMLNNGEVEL